MPSQQLTDHDIIQGFRRGDAKIIRQYFYGYCRAGYSVFDQKYQLSEKENLDFYSMAHQYALYLIERDWEPLEDRSPAVSLKTWIVGGLRYVVLDALKWYRKEYGSITFQEYLMSFETISDLRLQFNKLVEDVCDNFSLSLRDRTIIEMMLLKGYQGNEVAERLGMTPSAVSQRFKRLKEEVIVPYFKKNFDMELDMPEVMESRTMDYNESRIAVDYNIDIPHTMSTRPPLLEKRSRGIRFSLHKREKKDMENKRTTPEFITSLEPNEIFVFGSNLKGMHGGGAAYVAYRKFGAIMGQGVGLQGQSYAIPTMQGGVETIRPYVDEFIAFAKEHKELTFLVTRIGCGIAGFVDAEIAPLFVKAHDIENIVLPEGW